MRRCVLRRLIWVYTACQCHLPRKKVTVTYVWENRHWSIFWSWFYIYTPIYKRLINFANACTPPTRSLAMKQTHRDLGFCEKNYFWSNFRDRTSISHVGHFKLSHCVYPALQSPHCAPIKLSKVVRMQKSPIVIVCVFFFFFVFFLHTMKPFEGERGCTGTPITNLAQPWLLFKSDLGPVVQSVVSLTSSVRVISLTVLADSIYNILISFAEKMWVAFALQKLLTFFQQKISAYLRITRCKF